ncbi:MAG: hypothetical protein H6738_22230 [Alphaproteobacteria bacterium]|nr:hypothetical protein [Alphaproteobacteria bacterium]MCB9699518.1 hypothetical protein [Alphaproteobacteria bacterium]
MLFLFAAAASAQSLTVSGPTCPGAKTGTVTGVTPGGRVAFVTGAPGGNAVIPPGFPCAGTVLDVGNPTLQAAPVASAQGTLAIQTNVPAGLCSQDVQILDVATCTTSAAVPIHSTCQGTLMDPGNGIPGCWYTAATVGMTCTDVCSAHGGFDVTASQHIGNAVGMFFWPGKTNGTNWETVECSSTDNNTNWGANGSIPSAVFSHPACYVNCACYN